MYINDYFDSRLLPQISRQRGAEYAQEVDAIFMETSALNATNVEEIFVQISAYYTTIYHSRVRMTKIPLLYLFSPV